MGVVLVLLGLLPLLFLGDVFPGAGDDASGDDEAEADEAPPKSLASLLDDETASGGTSPLKPITDDPEPYAGAEVDPDTILTPNEDDEAPGIGEWVDPATVLDPVDVPGEGGVGGDGSTLQHLIERESDFSIGLGWLGDQVSDTQDYLLDDEASLVVLPQDGAGEGSLDSFDGTPIIDADGALSVVDGAGGDDTIVLGNAATYAFGGDGDDQLAATTGTAALFGGAGVDVLSGGPMPAFMDGGAGDDTLLGGTDDDMMFGGSHDDAGADTSDDDWIDGGAGNDRIAGGYGADTLFGGSGDDIIDHHGRVEEEVAWERHAFGWHTDGAPDSLDGGAGDDLLIMDRHDTATGGEGLDTFWIYHDAGEGIGAAEVMDFEPGLDFLRVSLNPDLDHGDLTVTVAPSPDGLDAQVSVDGQIVAILRGAVDATASDVLVDVTPDIFA